ncbi:MAG TPA: AraC family transcriptional regulator [Vicinamibacterales bacterium]|nr:AraC family transcriptional regulator [Vicinamibacterales bacterium]
MATDWRITWTMDYMQRHLAEPLTVAELAGRVNLSPSRFRDLFSVQTGCGPVEYLQRLRMRRARLLIERTFLTVGEAMARVGYADPRHFARDFERYHGVAPSSLHENGLTTTLPHEDPCADAPPVKRPRQRRPREPGFVFIG